MAGLVSVDDAKVDKAGHLFPESAAIRLKEPYPPFVSRGGIKLEGAIKHFSLNVQIPLSAGFERIIEIIAGVKQELERPIHWKGRSFSIPTDTELGFAFNKKTMLEWKASYFNSKTPTELSQELSSYVQKHS